MSRLVKLILTNCIFYSAHVLERLRLGFKLFFLLFLIFGLSATENHFHPENDDTVDVITVVLTEEEKTFLEELGPVLMCVDPDWEPYEWVTEDGVFEGIAADLIYLIASRLGITLELVLTADWAETIEYWKKGKCHIVAFLTQTPAREEWLIFTDVYFSDPNVFITREEHDYISDPAHLIDKTVVLPYGTAVEERLRREYPNLNFINTDDEAQAFYKVSARQADMTVRSLTVAAYTIRKQGYFNLKIAGHIPEFDNDFRIGVLKEHEILRDIFNKGIETLTDREVRDIVNKHISIVVVNPVNYGLIFRILTVVLILIIIGYAWNYKLKNLNDKLSQQKKELEILTEKLSIKGQQLRLVIDTVPNYIFAKDIDGRYILANNTFGKIWGMHPDEILGKTDIDLSNDDEQIKTLRSADLEVIKSGKPLYIPELKVKLNDGSQRWLQSIKIPYRQPGHDKPAVLVVSVDITDRKSAENLIIENELRLKNIIRSLPGLVYQMQIFKDKSLKYLFVSDRVSKFGVTPEDVYKDAGSLLRIIDADVDDLIDSTYKSANENKLWTRQFKVFSPEGRVLWMEAYDSSVYLEDESIICTGYANDITDRKELEQAYAENSAFQELVAKISSGFVNTDFQNIDEKIDWMLEKSGMFLSVDRAFLFQFTEDETCMSNSHEWCGEGIIPVKETVQNYPVANVPWIAEIVKKRDMLFVPDVDALPDNASAEKKELQKQQVKSVLCIPVVKYDRLLGYLGFDAVKTKVNINDNQIKWLQILSSILGDALLRNQSEEEIIKANDELREAYKQLKLTQDKYLQLEKKNTVLAMAVTANHEINQPLMIIQGNIDILKIKMPEDSLGKYFDNIINSITRIRELLVKYEKFDQIETTEYTDDTPMLDFKK